MTRFIASLTMTLVMWLTCCTGAVAAEGTNPPPCLLPFDCIKSPVLSGVISGPTVICVGVPGTWTLNESFTPGLKQKCEETAIAVTKTKTEWVWNYVGGPEASDGFNPGTSFTNTFTQEGTYTIKWDGTATLSDSVCDPVISLVEMTFTVVKPTPKAVLTSIVTKPDPICLDEESDGICTIGDQSPCDAGAYTVKWKVESDGGPQNLQFTPASGQVALTFMQSVDLKFKIKAGPGAKGGTAKIKLTATVNGADQTTEGIISVIELKSVTHNALDFERWTPGATVVATVVVDGGLGNKEILYELINVDSGVVAAFKSVAATTATLPIDGPGRYRVRATCCMLSVVTGNPFVLWKLTATPNSTEFVWDQYRGRLDEVFASADEEAHSFTAKIAQLDQGNTALKFAADAAKEEPEQVQHALKTLQNQLNTQLQQATATQSALDAAKAQLEANRIQLRASLEAARNAHNATLVTQLEASLVANTALLADNQSQLKAIGNTITAYSQRIKDAVRASESVAKSVGRYALTVAACEFAEKILAPAGLAVEIIELVELSDKTQKYQKELAEAKAEAPKYKNLIEKSLKDKAHRESPPLTKGVSITTIPGGLKVKLAEIPSSFLTKDKKMPDAGWIPNHLLIFNGGNGWIGGPQVQELDTTGGVQGKVGIALMAYGNLGSSSVYAFCQDAPAGKIVDATSTGSTQEELLAAISSKLTEAKENEETWKTALEALTLAVGITGGVIATIGLIVGETFVVTVGGVVVLIGVAIGILATIAVAVYNLFSKEPLVKSIINLFPSSKA